MSGAVDALRQGNKSAFVTLVAEHQASMVRIAMQYVRNHATAEEVAQETWLAALRGLDHFEGRATIVCRSTTCTATGALAPTLLNYPGDHRLEAEDALQESLKSLQLRKATRVGVPAIVAMLASDVLGSEQEEFTYPLPRTLHHLADRRDRRARVLEQPVEDVVGEHRVLRETQVVGEEEHFGVPLDGRLKRRRPLAADPLVHHRAAA